MRSREAFSSVFFSVCCFTREFKPRISSTLREFMSPSNKTDADGLAVAVALTLKLARIARVFVRFAHVASFVVNAKHGVPIVLPRWSDFSKLCGYENDNPTIKKFD